MKTNKVLFEVERGSGKISLYSFLVFLFDLIDDDDDNFKDDLDQSAGRFVQYHFPSSFLKLKQVGAL
jgi:hypothetical protein